MELLIVGLLLFLGLHLVPTVPRLRGALVAKLGRNPYRALFSVLSVAAFVVLVIGYARADYIALWQPPGLRALAMPLMFVAFVLLVAAYVPSNLKRVVPNPFLAAVVLWAVAHLLVRGDAASVLLFGAFIVYAVYDWWSVEHRGARKPAGRHARWKDALVVAIGAFVFFGALHFHPLVIGVPVR